MSKEIDDLRRKFSDRFSGGVPDMVFPATVTEICEDDFSCTVRRDDQVDYYDVRLRGLLKNELQGIAFIPKLQSCVLVCRIGTSNELFVCQYTEIDGIVFTCNDLDVRIDRESIGIAKGQDLNIHVDSDRVEVSNGKTVTTHESDSITLQSEQSTVRLSTSGITVKKGGSGLKKTLEKMLDGICQLTVPTGVGPSGVPINSTVFRQIKADLPNYMEE